jgi:epoxyqueuosine reductase QueG
LPISDARLGIVILKIFAFKKWNVSQNLKEHLVEWLGDRVDAVGFAPVDRFDGAPERHHPARICKDAKTVIVLGTAVPRGILRSPDYSLYFLHRTYHSVYPYLDSLALALSNWLEAQGDILAVPIPSFAPLVYNGLEPWGILSLKHAAVRAGLGSFGRSGYVFHPRYGALLRLSAVVTNAELPGDPAPDMAKDPCPPKCRACIKVCPSKAFDEQFKFDKLACLTHTIKHAIYPLALQSEDAFKHLERITNTAGYNYWIDCCECLKVCPNNRPKSSADV